MLVDVLARRFPTLEGGHLYEFLADSPVVCVIERFDGSQMLWRRTMGDGLWPALHRHDDWATSRGPGRKYWKLRMERDTWTSGPDLLRSWSSASITDLAQTLIGDYIQAQAAGHTWGWQLRDGRAHVVACCGAAAADRTWLASHVTG